MKTIKIEVPDWIDEKVVEEAFRRALSAMVSPSELTADEVKETFGVIGKDASVEAEDALKLREKEKEERIARTRKSQEELAKAQEKLPPENPKDVPPPITQPAKRGKNLRALMNLFSSPYRFFSSGVGELL